MADTKIITPYSNIAYIPLEEKDSFEDLSRVRALQVGFGSRVMRVDREGLWLGADTFAAAPFKVDMDGNVTATSLTITGYIPTGGALGDIGTGGITSGYIAAGAITASKISVSTLSAISADIGSVTAGTVTGATLRTSSSGARVEMTGATDALRVYDASALRMALDADEFIFYDTGGTRMGSMTNASGFLIIEVDSTSYATVFNINGVTKASITNAGLNVNDDILAATSGVDIGSVSQPFEDLFVDDLRLTSQSTNPTSDGMLRYYNSGGTEGLRMQLGGADFQFDATGV